MEAIQQRRLTDPNLGKCGLEILSYKRRKFRRRQMVVRILTGMQLPALMLESQLLNEIERIEKVCGVVISASNCATRASSAATSESCASTGPDAQSIASAAPANSDLNLRVIVVIVSSPRESY
jgi:hypothetical protein